MGNCLVIEGKDVIDKMRIDGSNNILEYKSPMKVQLQVLSKFPEGNFITDDLPVVRDLDQVADMQLGGHLSYLLRRKKEQQVKKAGVVRSVRVVIRKQELKEILEKEGLTLEDMMVSQVPAGNIKEEYRCMGWKPDLESILEGGNDIEGLKRTFTV